MDYDEAIGCKILSINVTPWEIDIRLDSGKHIHLFAGIDLDGSAYILPITSAVAAPSTD